MIKKILDVYEKLNADLINKMAVNNKQTRDEVNKILENKLDNCVIICDETNNNPTIINECICLARVMWKTNNTSHNYVDLIFGNPQQIANIIG